MGKKGGKGGGKRKRKRKNDDDDEDFEMKPSKKRRRAKKGDDGDFHCSVSVEKKIDEDNPMADFVDIMTSKHKNVCPFTMQKLTRRSLVKLTKANYEEYKGQIKNISAAEQANMALVK